RGDAVKEREEAGSRRIAAAVVAVGGGRVRGALFWPRRGLRGPGGGAPGGGHGPPEFCRGRPGRSTTAGRRGGGAPPPGGRGGGTSGVRPQPRARVRPRGLQGQAAPGARGSAGDRRAAGSD